VIELLGLVSGAISLLKDANTVHDSYKKVSGILHGTDHEKLMGVMQKMQQEQETYNAKVIDSFERLSDHIIYAPNLQAVRDNNISHQRQVDDLRQVRESLDPIQKALGGDLLSSAMIWTPDKMQQAFNKSPWEVLIDVRPISHASKPNNADMIPFIFEQGGIQYIGWQAKGVIPMMFDCEYNEIWTPSSVLSNKKTLENNRISLNAYEHKNTELSWLLELVTSGLNDNKLSFPEFGIKNPTPYEKSFIEKYSRAQNFVFDIFDASGSVEKPNSEKCSKKIRRLLESYFDDFDTKINESITVSSQYFDNIKIEIIEFLYHSEKNTENFCHSASFLTTLSGNEKIIELAFLKEFNGFDLFTIYISANDVSKYSDNLEKNITSVVNMFCENMHGDSNMSVNEISITKEMNGYERLFSQKFNSCVYEFLSMWKSATSGVSINADLWSSELTDIYKNLRGSDGNISMGDNKARGLSYKILEELNKGGGSNDTFENYEASMVAFCANDPLEVGNMIVRYYFKDFDLSRLEI